MSGAITDRLNRTDREDRKGKLNVLPASARPVGVRRFHAGNPCVVAFRDRLARSRLAVALARRVDHAAAAAFRSRRPCLAGGFPAGLPGAPGLGTAAALVSPGCRRLLHGGSLGAAFARTGAAS